MSQLMSSLGLTTFPLVALVLFVLAFGAICWRAWREPGARHAAIPLHDDSPTTPGATRVERS